METKHCNQCDRTLSVDSFYRRGPTGRQARCKECQTTNRRNSWKPHEVARRRHKFTDEQYSEIISRASDGCESCGKDMGKKICFDHCHETGKFRGLLCHNCNTLLGLAKDSIATLDNASNYLRKHETL